ncbi:hypothetical protein G7085_06970 [Tessaracoccus sp. HDW20]|uniref:hypothetical protein n=1 Tax=Tessaracoccus coleopterorum TaxID=2714950 RepID=UPI0018D45E80|nr:hypothetical protein [Tessaracoccus coleopterorum]NHB84434.1 hypothetical protein [Tessaracoccus coleopterorum]
MSNLAHAHPTREDAGHVAGGRASALLASRVIAKLPTAGRRSPRPPRPPSAGRSATT